MSKSEDAMEKIADWVVCPDCNGSGKNCKLCRGNPGWVLEPKPE